MMLLNSPEVPLPNLRSRCSGASPGATKQHGGNNGPPPAKQTHYQPPLARTQYQPLLAKDPVCDKAVM